MRILICAWLACVPALVGAAALPDWLTPYPHAEQKKQRSAAVDDYLLALGIFKRANGGWQPEQSLRLGGELLRMTWRTPEGHSIEEAHRHWLGEFEPVLRRVLFSCRGRGCGSSHRWASEVFRVRELAGSDGSQHYDVLELARDGQVYVAALYSVQRGNHRIYTQLDLIALPDRQAQRLWITADTLIGRLRHTETVVLDTFGPEARTQEGSPVSAVQLDALALALRKDVRLQLDVRGYAYADAAAAADGAPGDALRRRAKRYAEQVKAELMTRGIDPDRVRVVEMETMSPAAFGPVDRVELQRRI